MVPGVVNSKTGTASTYVRRAHHAGSWYGSDPSILDELLSTFLLEAQRETAIHLVTEVVVGQHNDNTTNPSSSSLSSSRNPSIRAIVAPHAGYRYSGSTAAFAYLALKQYFQEASLVLDDNGNNNNQSVPYVTIVILHPSHHCYVEGCAISGASSVETPLINIPVDDTLRSALLKTDDFTIMDRRMDEEEHSGEMQYPFIAKMYREYQSSLPSNHTSVEMRILPIMVGALSTSQEEYYGNLLSTILSRPYICTIISSDFCHWGSRFRFSPLPTQPQQEIYEYIEWLDRLGMNYISMQQPGAFASYLKQYNNTICGRHPIGVWLHAITKNRSEQLEVTFVHYKQSSLVKSSKESSVSYAAAIARVSVKPK